MKAVETFRTAPWRHNCAQAIANRWHHLFPQGAAVVVEYAPLVGGSAPGGMCGALYAATQACPQRSDEIIDRFHLTVGATCCRDIKGVGRVPCQVCVETADKILESLCSR